jgi:hypothetical protein
MKEILQETHVANSDPSVAQACKTHSMKNQEVSIENSILFPGYNYNYCISPGITFLLKLVIIVI